MIADREDVTREVVAELAALSPSGLPGEVARAAARRILDTIGVIIGGSGLGDGSRRLAGMVTDEGGAPESRILGTGVKVPARAAALANGGFAHALDYDDVFSPARVHPDAITVPAALAVADRQGDVSGPELVAAVALADELTIRIGKAIFGAPKAGEGGGFPGRKWHPTLVAGYFGATAAAGRLLRLDTAGMLNAFGITLYRTGGTLAYVKGARNLVAELYYGFPAEVGVTSALLASRGVTGPQDAFEGEGGLFPAFFGSDYERAALTDGFGKSFELGVETKPWPAVRTSHAYIEAALRLVGEHDLKPEDLTEIVIRCGRLAQLACEPLALRRRPRTAIDAKFSIPFIVSVALARRGVKIRHFVDASLDDPVVLGLADRVRIEPDPSLDGSGGFRGAGLVAAEVEVRTTAGDRHRARVELGRGGPANPMTDGEVAEKFRDCCSYAARPMPEADVEAALGLAARLPGLERLDPFLELL